MCASAVFYIFFNLYQILFIIVITAFNYAAGLFIERRGGLHKKAFLVLSIMVNCLFLFVFKYLGFFLDSVSVIGSLFNIKFAFTTLKIFVPLGISYITFQLLSYLIEVYRGNQKAEVHPGIFALSVLFFPKIISGPIERPGDLLHQFHETHDLDYSRIADGLKIMAWGYFKKVVIADRLAIVVGSVYGNVHNYSGFPLFIAAIFFTLQLYFDFSGYTDIAVGSARIMGIRLTQNFDRPLFAHTLTDFWRRWHITLSSWIRDYLYTPIAINRRYWGKAGIVFALMTAFTLCGLWHGASWNYVLFGFFNGVGLSIEFLVQKARNKLNKRVPAYIGGFINISLTFLFFSFTLIFFRAATVSDSWYVITHMFSGFWSSLGAFLTQKAVMLQLGLRPFEFKIALLSVLIAQTLEFLQNRGDLWEIISRKNVKVRWGIYYLILLGIALFGVFSSKAQFIYFQF